MEITDLLIEIERFISMQGLNRSDSINELIEKLNEVPAEEME